MKNSNKTQAHQCGVGERRNCRNPTTCTYLHSGEKVGELVSAYTKGLTAPVSMHNQQPHAQRSRITITSSSRRRRSTVFGTGNASPNLQHAKLKRNSPPKTRNAKKRHKLLNNYLNTNNHLRPIDEETNEEWEDESTFYLSTDDEVSFSYNSDDEITKSMKISRHEDEHNEHKEETDSQTEEAKEADSQKANSQMEVEEPAEERGTPNPNPKPRTDDQHNICLSTFEESFEESFLEALDVHAPQKINTLD